MRRPSFRLSSFLALLAAFLIATPAVDAKDKKSQASSVPPKDGIEVAGHIALTDGPVRSFLATQHYRSFYLYAQRDAGKSITLIDVTKTDQPTILGEISSVPNSDTASLAVVAGTSALAVSAAAPQASAQISEPQPPQTIKVMDFSDPRNPKVAREFTGVTAISRDDARGLIFIATADGIWILRKHFAEDPKVQKAYENYVFYGSSMYH